MLGRLLSGNEVKLLVAHYVLAHYHNRLSHTWMLAQQRFHLTQLYAKTANLHLMIDSSKNSNLAPGQIPRQIAGPVESRARLVTERVRNKFFSRELGLFQ